MGVSNGGVRGVWPPVLEIGPNRPFLPFAGGPEEHLENPEYLRKKAFFSSDIQVRIFGRMVWSVPPPKKGSVPPPKMNSEKPQDWRSDHPNFQEN